MIIFFENGRLGNQLIQYNGFKNFFPKDKLIFIGCESLLDTFNGIDAFFINKKKIGHKFVYIFLMKIIFLLARVRIFGKITKIEEKNSYKISKIKGLFWSVYVTENFFFSISDIRGFKDAPSIKTNLVEQAKDWFKIRKIDLKTHSVTDLEVTSIYLNGNIDLSDQWIMVLGARHESVETTIAYSEGASGRSAVRELQNTKSRDDSNLSPRLGVIYKPQENMSLYLSYSESFIPKSGEQYKSWGTNAAFDPDVYENTELGFKYDLDSGISLALSYFDQETVKGQEDGVGGSEVIGMAIDGFEFGVAGQVNDQNSINFGLTNVDATKSAGAGEQKEIPELTWSLWYTHQANDLFSISFGAIYQDDQLINKENEARLDDFTRLDMSMVFTPSDSDTVRLNIENLSDDTYYPHSHSTHQATVGEPLNLRVSYQKTF